MTETSVKTESESHILFKIMFKINTFTYYKPNLNILIQQKTFTKKNLNNNNNIEFSDNKIINEQILDFFKNEYNKFIQNTSINYSITSSNKRKTTNELFKYKNATYKVLRRKREFWMFIES